MEVPMVRLRHISISSSIHAAKRLTQLLTYRQLYQAVRTVTPMLFAFALSGIAHAQGTMDFSGAQTLMGTFKTPYDRLQSEQERHAITLIDLPHITSDAIQLPQSSKKFA